MTSWPEGVAHEDVTSIVNIVAGQLHRQYRQHVEVEDIRQVLIEWCWKKRDKLAEYLVRDTPHDRKRGQAALTRSLQREGQQHCRREKARRSGYEPSDEFFYSVALIEDVLAEMLTGTTSSHETAARHTPGDPAEGGNRAVIVADVKTALADLDDDTRGMVVNLLGMGVPANQIAVEHHITGQAVRQRVQRACVKMVRKLGGESPWRPPS